MDFVDSVLALQVNAPLNRFHLKWKEAVDEFRLLGWIRKVLERGVLDVDLQVLHISSSSREFYLPSEIFVSKTLVRLKIRVQDWVTIDVEDIDVSLPRLKALHLDSVSIENNMFAKLLSGCHELEELVLNDLIWDSWEPFSVSSTTLKRLTFCHSGDLHEHNESVSFDTPNLVYLEYSDTIAVKYPQVSFDPLVEEARLGLRMTDDQLMKARYATDKYKIIGNVTDLLMGIRNVKILYLSDDTLEVLAFCCETVPVFDNLVQLTIKTEPEAGWKSLTVLLKNCPNLETLVFEGLHHKLMPRLGEEDPRKYPDEWERVPTCLSSSPVKYLRILKFGEICNDDDYIEEQIEQLEIFLKTMPNLELMILYYDTPVDEDVIKLFKKLRMLPRVASSTCKIQVISDNLSLSSIVPMGSSS